MREILFRGKRGSDGKWLYGNYAKCEAMYNWKDVRPEPRTWIQAVDESSVALILDPVDPATVGQFTGMTDKNGNKIFEGDIVKGLFLFGMDVPAVAAFRDGAFGLLWQRGNVTEFSAFTSICNVEYEVIGNIHDNKELSYDN